MRGGERDVELGGDVGDPDAVPFGEQEQQPKRVVDRFQSRILHRGNLPRRCSGERKTVPQFLASENYEGCRPPCRNSLGSTRCSSAWTPPAPPPAPWVDLSSTSDRRPPAPHAPRRWSSASRSGSRSCPSSGGGSPA